MKLVRKKRLINKTIMKTKKEKPIDKVTSQYLKMGLKMAGINLSYETIDMIIDIVELIEDKGGNVSISDICELIDKAEVKGLYSKA